jgi:hypothetical protein
MLFSLRVALLAWLACGCVSVRPKYPGQPEPWAGLVAATPAPPRMSPSRSEEELEAAAERAAAGDLPPAACKLVVQAKRMFLGWEEGMELSDLKLFSQSSKKALRALNRAVCKLVVRVDLADLNDAERSLLAEARSGARFEVDHVKLNPLLHVKVRVRIKQPASAPEATARAAWEAVLQPAEAGYALSALSALAQP